MAFKPNRDLLNVNFEGYKLSPSPITCFKCETQGEVHQAKLKDGDFSYQHMKAFSLHSHLTVDPYDDCSVYWCSKDGCIEKATYMPSTGGLSMSVVYGGNAPEPSCNTSLAFVSKELCLYCPGSSTVTLLYTGIRSEANEWEVVKTFTLSADRPPTLITTAHIIPSSSSAIQVLCAELQDTTASSKDDTPPAIAQYTWYSLKFKKPIETIDPNADSICNSVEELAVVTSFSAQSLALYTAFQSHPSNDTHYLLFMSETQPNLNLKNTDPPNASTPEEEPASVADEDTPFNDGSRQYFGLGYDSQGYDWSQSDSDVVVKFKLPKGVKKRDINCVISSKAMVVGLTDGTSFFRGDLNGMVDTEASTWTIEDDVLEVTLEKAVAGVHWSYLHGEGGASHHTLVSEGREESTAENTGNKTDGPPAVKRPRPLVSTELEDCDTTEEDSTLYLVSQDGDLVYKASLSGSQLVLTAPSKPGHAHYFALRHDVDAPVWLPPPTTHSPPNGPSWSHVDTFNALGYVQASKANRKFTTCPPNLKYSVITDCNRHIFVYAQPKIGFKGNNAEEFVHTLSEKTGILGVAASNEHCVFVLTSSTLYGLKLPL